MPSRNIIKIDIPDSYYHIYARGINKRKIFNDDNDYRYFINLLRRYLSSEDIRNKNGVSYLKLFDYLEVLAYCQMQNHFHLLVYQIHEGAMSQLMRSVMTSYSIYFNRKYKRRGPLFESRYKASRINSDDYLMHISRYIHLNPNDWQNHPHSSIHYYESGEEGDWLKSGKILDLFSSPAVYMDFMYDYKSVRDELEVIKHELAGY